MSEVREYKKIAEDALRRAKELLKEQNGWVLKKEDPEGVVMSEMEIEGQTIKCCKMLGFLPGVEAPAMAEALWNLDEAQRKKLEPMVKSWEVLDTFEGIGSKAKVYHQVNVLPWPITARDGVVLW